MVPPGVVALLKRKRTQEEIEHVPKIIPKIIRKSYDYYMKIIVEEQKLIQQLEKAEEENKATEAIYNQQVKAEEERLAAEAIYNQQVKAEEERLAAEAIYNQQVKAEEERLEAEKERLAAEKERLAAEKVEEERLAAEKERLAAEKAEQEEKLHISRLEAITRKRSRRVASRLERIQKETVYVPTIIQEEIVHMPTIIQPRVGFILPVAPKSRWIFLERYGRVVPYNQAGEYLTTRWIMLTKISANFSLGATYNKVKHETIVRSFP